MKFANLSEFGLTEVKAGEGVVVNCSPRHFPRIQDLQWNGVERWVAFARENPWWMKPHYGLAGDAIPPKTQFILLKFSDQSHAAVLPLVSSDAQCFLEGNPDGSFNLVWQGSPDGEFPMLAVAGHENPLQACRNIWKVAQQYLGTFKLRSQKSIPSWMDELGWCTWDAFYHDVTEEKILDALRNFSEKNIPIRWMILDDGWQEWKSQGDIPLSGLLTSLGPDPEKFPNGLSSFIDQVKQRGISYFGIWHALQGYWAGICPDASFAKDYRLIHTHRSLPRMEGTPHAQPINRYLIHPQDIERFYQTFHSFLRQQGVDFVKVDNQSSLEVFEEDPSVSTMQSYQRALQDSPLPMLHCMAHGNDVLFNLSSSNLLRNSDDFFPKVPESHSRHIRNNAFNNLWSSHIAIPDWDMFQSDHPTAEFHAMARALSGGPVYISDKPGRHNEALLRKLAFPDGRILRFENPALPTPDSIFTDPCKNPVPLKIYNTHRDAGLLGLFHCQYANSDSIPASFKPSDIPGLKGETFAAYFHKQQKLVLLEREEAYTFTLSHQSAELVTLVPIQNDFAPLGLIDKFAGIVAIRSCSLENNIHHIEVNGPGIFACYTSASPQEILTTDNASLPFTYKDSLLQVALPVFSGTLSFKIIT